MSQIIFTKLTGAGNDFVLLDRNLNPALKINPELIVKLCDRRFGIGGDGLLAISDSNIADFEMEYYNSDGTTGMLCGNGARCIIKYASLSGRIKNSVTEFIFQSDHYSGEVLSSDEIQFNLNPPKEIKKEILIEALGKKFTGSFINTGAHHVVINLSEQNFDESELKNIHQFPVEKFGKEIRYSKQFAPTGTNVNFVSYNNNLINIRTYERGVEQETLACGTGSVASAIILHLKNKIKKPVVLKTKSGELLKVDFTIFNSTKIENVTLAGPAKIVFEGKIEI